MRRSKLGPSLITAALLLAICALGPSGLWHPAPWLLAAAAVMVMLTQPTPTAAELRSSSDRLSALAILLAGNLTVLAPAIEYALRREVRPAPLAWTVLAGAALLAGGVAFRVWAIRTLDTSFTAVVKTSAEQRLIATGPYRWLRHPSYTGIVVALTGAAVLFESLWAAASIVVVMLPVYVYRIRLEEQALVDRFGDEYRAFAARRWALLPPVY
jgi:protein-S-isoprenylcysteine O-methyltransferase Ste14